MVAIDIFFLISLLVTRFLSYSMRGTTKMNHRVSVNASLIRSIDWLTEDLGRSTISHLLLVPQAVDGDPVTIGMVRTNGTDALGVMTWEEEFTVYRWEPDDRGLTRYTGASSPDFTPTDPVLPTEALINQLVGGTQTSVRRLSGDITRFEVSQPSGALVRVRLEAEDESAGNTLVVERTRRAQN